MLYKTSFTEMSKKRKILEKRKKNLFSIQKSQKNFSESQKFNFFVK